ncbi:MAG: radical SAM family heme chaperone HemW [Gammaproteobacteria bacterium]|nr:MAG: radical SAM family heme chaperone HemW [Gammaproteobacteria bacterium]
MQLPPLGLYIHLPWCERKCPYCDFNSHEAIDIPEMRYVDTLLRDLRGDLSLLQGRTIETLFIGGGTPSLFSTNAIRRLLQGIAALVPLSPTLEATMEANPGSAEADKFAGFRDAGINRLSLGIQSFDDAHLQSLGRIHNSDQARAAIEFARAANFDSFNIDLMHGLPGQTPASAEADLRAALAYKPPHLSWYQLTIEPNTVFHKRPPQLPVEDELADIQQYGETLLADAGCDQYEVSAYCQPGYHCRHNLNYWSFGDYLGIGAGAHGKISFPDGRIQRYAKKRQPGDYLASGPGEFTASSRELDRDEIAGEFMLNALRLNQGFTLDLFSAHTGLDAVALEPQLESLYRRELLVRSGDCVKATDLGRRFLDSVVAEFFP